ncbi:HAD family hydrolase [Vagococcus acidifermentans]|uniref:Hydrolase n=1 Tax=Vagococcus acidifermentans TaxID=564710 RepID=A0A430ARL1_9ENTE|nr:HAD family phosphatase [Vagococcus acidifermentans]RSU10687.1 hypothetical protein CBF27_10255 [Vagococcus acidifermentans]
MKTIIFDMDGTLINSEKKYYHIWENLLAEKKYSITLDFYKRILGKPTNQIKREFLHYFGDSFPFDLLFKKFMIKRSELISDADFELNEGVLKFVSWCSYNNVICGVATSSLRNETHHILNKLDILDIFSFSLCGDDVSKGKPHPEIFQKAAALTTSKKKDIIVFEDSMNGVISANKAGLTVCHINDFIPLTGEIKRIPIESYKDFNDVLKSKIFLELMEIETKNPVT